jgi:hypothetical protein
MRNISITTGEKNGNKKDDLKDRKKILSNEIEIETSSEEITGSKEAGSKKSNRN